jgi:hypothetical protein
MPVEEDSILIDFDCSGTDHESVFNPVLRLRVVYRNIGQEDSSRQISCDIIKVLSASLSEVRRRGEKLRINLKDILGHQCESSRGLMG